jgi:hypothetical protein
MTEDRPPLRPWSTLDSDEQTALRGAYQVELDKEPPTCSMDTKVERFANWLAARGVSFSMDDLRQPKRQRPS